MGLDVYLSRCKDLKAAEEYDERETAAGDKIYADLKREAGLTENQQLSPKQWDEYRRRKSAWVKENKAPVKDTEVSQKSDLHPEHMFTVGYFRSSYNESGTNSVLRAATGKDLYWIFEPPENEYRFVPDWKRALERAKEARAAYAEHLSVVGPVKVMQVRANMFTPKSEQPKSAEDAMKIFRVQQERHHERFSDPNAKEPFSTKDYNWYGNRDGDFFLGKGATLLGAIPGRSSYGENDVVYLVIRENEPESGTNWYLAALDVVVETIEYVLRHKKPNEFYLRWSA